MQPTAVALIITGFPAFDNALQAIRQQVDDYLVKPVPPLDLVTTIERLRNTRTRHMPLPSKRPSAILREDYPFLEQQVLRRMKDYARRIGRTDLEDEALVDHLPQIIGELCDRVEKKRAFTSETAKEKSVAHGLLRRQQGLKPTFILNEASYVRDAILQLIHQHLLNVDMSYLLVDLGTMNESLDEQLNIAMDTLIKGEAAA
jgi:YesN/AraC family two-component response regulator